MDLHNLHRPSASAQQAATQNSQNNYTGSESCKESSTHMATAGIQDALEKARAEAVHWKKETERMDRIAHEAMEKLKAKRAAKRALKEECLAWKDRYQELSRACMANKDTSRELDQARITIKHQDNVIQEHVKAIAKFHSTATSSEELAKAHHTIRQYEKERQDVKGLLQIGGEAHRKVQALESRLAAAQAEIATLKTNTSTQNVAAIMESTRNQQVQSELAAVKDRLRATEAQLAATKDRLRTTEAELAPAKNRLRTTEAELAATKDRLRTTEAEVTPAKNRLRTIETQLAATKDRLRTTEAEVTPAKDRLRTTEAELAATKDKLRTAAQNALAVTSRAQACEDMLARAEQVLSTCCKLHAAKNNDEEANPLADALQETVSTIGKYLHERSPTKA